MKHMAIKINRVIALLLALIVAAAAMGTTVSPIYGASAGSVVKKAKVKVSLTAGEGFVTVKWNKVKQATGYEVYSAEEKAGKYKKIATVKKSATIKFVHKNLKQGKAYYYKVRAYQTVKGKKVYSKYSAVKGKKTLMGLNAHIDAFLKKAIKTSMTKEQKLKAAYEYMRDQYRYIPRSMVNKDDAAWMNQYAKAFFADKGGNCYSWAAAFTVIAKKLGYEAQVCAGTLDGKVKRTEHAWTEITIDGIAYIFDPQTENIEKLKDGTIDLYKLAYDNGDYVYTKK